MEKLLWRKIDEKEKRKKALEEGNDWLFSVLMFIKSTKRGSRKKLFWLLFLFLVIRNKKAEKNEEKRGESLHRAYYISQATFVLIEFDLIQRGWEKVSLPQLPGGVKQSSTKSESKDNSKSFALPLDRRYLIHKQSQKDFLKPCVIIKQRRIN